MKTSLHRAGLALLLLACAPSPPPPASRNQAVVACTANSDCPAVGACMQKRCNGQRQCVPISVTTCCNANSDCDDGDPCSLDTCVGAPNGNCSHVASLDGGVGNPGVSCCNMSADCPAPNACQGASPQCPLPYFSCTYTSSGSAGCCLVSKDCGGAIGQFTCVANECGCVGAGLKYCVVSHACSQCCASSDCVAGTCQLGSCSAGACSFVSTGAPGCCNTPADCPVTSCAATCVQNVCGQAPCGDLGSDLAAADLEAADLAPADAAVPDLGRADLPTSPPDHATITLGAITPGGCALAGRAPSGWTGAALLLLALALLRRRAA